MTGVYLPQNIQQIAALVFPQLADIQTMADIGQAQQSADLMGLGIDHSKIVLAAVTQALQYIGDTGVGNLILGQCLQLLSWQHQI